MSICASLRLNRLHKMADGKRNRDNTATLAWFFLVLPGSTPRSENQKGEATREARGAKQLRHLYKNCLKLAILALLLDHIILDFSF